MAEGGNSWAIASPVNHSHKGRSRAVVTDEEEDNEANWNSPSSTKQKSQGASSNLDQVPEAGRLRMRSSSGAVFPMGRGLMLQVVRQSRDKNDLVPQLKQKEIGKRP
ncbi:hypothetical protein KY285_036058 [Solanum tuberosum]|nr:hypothetical protein KY285_036058 [Solanum tuberosum]